MIRVGNVSIKAVQNNGNSDCKAENSKTASTFQCFEVGKWIAIFSMSDFLERWNHFVSNNFSGYLRVGICEKVGGIRSECFSWSLQFWIGTKNCVVYRYCSGLRRFHVGVEMLNLFIHPWSTSYNSVKSTLSSLSKSLFKWSTTLLIKFQV